MPRAETLRAAVAGSRAGLVGRGATAACDGIAPLAHLSGAHVLLRTAGQLSAALALIALDGVAARMVIAPPDVMVEHLPAVMERAAIDVVVSDDPALAVPGARFELLGGGPGGEALPAPRQTEWVLFTSGTTGIPKMVAHSLTGLTDAISTGQSPPRGEASGGGGARSGACGAKGGGGEITWGTFYDIRRYGGLQILLRALLGHAPLVLSDAGEDVAAHLARLGANGVTHLTGTPSHWRRVLMSPANAAINPSYVRLSGEIADQAILDSLKARFPAAAIGHAYASTEAGVGFEVTDGLEGFPASYIGRPGPVEMKVVDGTLRIRSPRTASEYVGGAPAREGEPINRSLLDDGWVDTGDMVELRGARYYFAGRAGGIINVGGLKINPEEVEAVINRHPGVRMSRVSGRKNPITGAIVTAEIVLTDSARDDVTFRDSVLAACRKNLPAFKVPASLRIVPALELTAAGKLLRSEEGRHHG